jgi:hypothetical protein
MRRTVTVLATAAFLTLGGAVLAGPAAAAPGEPGLPAQAALGAASGKSVLVCGGGHPGQHKGWSNQPSTERRNVGGTCPA